MIVREYRGEDAVEVAAIHEAMGSDYQMIDMASPLVIAKTICEHDGKIIAATALKLEAETYLWVAPDAKPAAKWDAIRLMQRDIAAQALRLGIEQLVAYVPGCVEKFFFKRLLSLGWERQRDGWRAWSFEVKR